MIPTQPKWFGLSVIVLFLLASIMVLAGCAPQAAVKETRAEAAPTHDFKRITAISAEEDSDAVFVRVKGDQLLTYTSVKQPSPPGIILYFPQTALDLKPIDSQAVEAIELITSIQTSELTENGQTARIEILLDQDVSYDVSREDAGLKIRFQKAAAMAAVLPPPEAAGRTDAPSETAPSAAPSAQGATRLESIDAQQDETGLHIAVRADGAIDDYKSFTLDGPARIVFDLYGLQSPYHEQKVIALDTRWIQRVRHYNYPDRLRLVLDTRTEYLSAFKAKTAPDGLTIFVSDAAPVAEAAQPQSSNPADKPAWVNRIDFSSEEAGKSMVVIGTTAAVKYEVQKKSDQQLLLKLFNTRLPEYRKRPLITTRFESAVDRIMPVQTAAMKDTTLVAIELRESVPYFVEQTDDLLMLHFEASGVPPKPFEEAQLPAWKEVYEQMADQAGALEADAGLPAEDATTLVAGRGKVYTGEKIALDFYKTDIKNVFRILREVSGKNFAIDDDVSGKVTLTLDNPVPWDQVLDLILKMNRLGRIYEGDIIRIATMGTLKAEEDARNRKMMAKREAENQEELVTEFFRINYADAMAIIIHLIEKGKLENNQGASKFNPERGRVSVDPVNNMIVVSDVARALERHRKIIQELDRVTPQVLIEARVVEATATFSRNLGITWGSAVGQSDSSVLGGLIDYNMAVNVPTTANGIFGINFAKLTGTTLALEAQLQAAESTSEGKIISSPKVMTLDGRTATIKQGLSYPYQTVEDGEVNIEFKEVDLALEVTPQVTPDQRIAMTINITKNDLGNVINNEQSFTTKEISTELLVEDGDTIVIGGIIKTTDTDSASGVPGLSKIPLLGWLFKSDTVTDNKEELLIFITPRIIQLAQRASAS